MIDYQTYCQIKYLHEKKLKSSQIGSELQLDRRTVEGWIEAGSYRLRKGSKRASKLDAFKSLIVRWLEKYDYSGQQILQRLRERGYEGGKTILNEYIASVRPQRTAAFLTLAFAPGECAQVDWGSYGSVKVGSTQRRLSFFVMVLCHSRMMYLEFTVQQSMEHFLACHQNAFNFFGAVPEKIMVDNLKSAVIARHIGQAPVFNRRYLDFSNHYGYTIRACGVGKGNEKGRVENAVGYVKKNFLAGLEISDFSALNPAARIWLDTVANVRKHKTTQKQPLELFAQDRASMRPLPDLAAHTALTRSVRATNRFRIPFDGNHYSVPAEYAGKRLTLKAYADRLCLYYNEKLIARHPRSYDRNADFENPDHPRELLKQRRAAKDQRLLLRLLQLSPRGAEYYQQLRERRMNVNHHIAKIIALAEIHGEQKVQRAIEDSFVFKAFSSDYIANIIEQQERTLPEPGALLLTRRQDLLDIDMPEPNLSIYETKGTDHE